MDIAFQLMKKEIQQSHKKRHGILCKLDVEKAYDHVSKGFLTRSRNVETNGIQGEIDQTGDV